MILRGFGRFCFPTDRLTDISDSRVAFSAKKYDVEYFKSSFRSPLQLKQVHLLLCPRFIRSVDTSLLPHLPGNHGSNGHGSVFLIAKWKKT